MNFHLLIGLLLPEGSIALIRKVCLPTFARLTIFGDLHERQSCLSKRHSNLAAGSSEPNRNLIPLRRTRSRSIRFDGPARRSALRRQRHGHSSGTRKLPSAPLWNVGPAARSS